MGLLVEGRWQEVWYPTKSTGGRFVRKDAAFRNWITVDGSAGPTGIGGFKSEAGRYHLYVSLACPWAHRTLIMRMLKGLEAKISVSVAHWLMLDHGWTFADGPGVVPDTVNHAKFLHEIYTAADPHYTGRATVPVLWDKHRRTIVNNESSEIIRMLNSEFDEVGARPGDYYPQALRADIDAVNARIYDTLNNGVYKAGFATTQAAYETAALPLFETLDWLEQRLADRRFLFGNDLTEADIRLFTTLIPFDPVYVRHFHGHIRAKAKRIDPTPTTILRDVSTGVALPDLTWIGANFTDADKRDANQVRALAGSEQLIAELEATDLLVIEAPLWNFSIPASLKAWFDQVVRARRTFRMSETGSEGLLKDRKTIVIVTTGGVPLGSGYDFATPYIRHILGFIGITGVTFIDAGRLMFENDKLDKARVEINTTLAGPLARAA